jgi:HEXXH motif-containing protein
MRLNDHGRIYYALGLFDNAESMNCEGISIEHIKTETWEDKIIRDYENKSIYGHIIRFKRASDDVLAYHKSLALKALDLIRNTDPVFYEEIEEYVSQIKLHHGTYIVGLTAPLFHGCIYISLPPDSVVSPILYYVEHLVHECSHLQLNMMLAKDKMLLNSPDERYDAPIRTDKRPILGVFHATFVLSRIVRVFNRLIYMGIEDVNEAKRLRTELTSKFIKGYFVLRDNARFTAAGKAIFNSFIETAFECLP